MFRVQSSFVLFRYTVPEKGVFKKRRRFLIALSRKNPKRKARQTGFGFSGLKI